MIINCKLYKNKLYEYFILVFTVLSFSNLLV